MVLGATRFFGKQLVEAACTRTTCPFKDIMVRFPYVLGIDDYTKRLYQYVDAYVHDKMNFISADDAGKFLAYLDTVGFSGAINGASDGQISMFEVLTR